MYIRIQGTVLLNFFVLSKFYIHGSVHRESNLITVQQDATYSIYYISVGSLCDASHVVWWMCTEASEKHAASILRV